MAGMFAQSIFNQDIGEWQTDSLEAMGGMFAGNIVFNQDIGQWNTSKVWSMSYVFHDAQAFDQDISGWDTGHVLEMMHMFRSEEHTSELQSRGELVCRLLLEKK